MFLFPPIYRWLKQIADDIPVSERNGGLCFDEMTIQDDLDVTHRGINSFFSGQIDMGDHANSMRKARQGICY